ncbi:hypothetical protein A1A1_17795 [Planococcus antarcticus DSM 14505]|uniref:UPF0346 protein A1A1_17795 n=1 Tax=Planococcus antarcticus DSM 14505 TaxID=1185653 RepID=A0A1C7DGY7_9BACL|nr:YozE family protein [Planococcus antarcticus]ANU10776.1 hypothetical protein BBH88_10885 [Planococcus antarcticus DSM 14505]EIM05156.1 hypothetical protein A1A1_17795 [Planococcus antarcticus DSM 14505]
MNRSFYQFALKYRGKMDADNFSSFADSMFLDHSFPKSSSDFDQLSKYVEEKAHPVMKASIFDKMWEEYTAE